MPTLTSEEMQLDPKRLIDDAQQGTSDVVTVEGEPVMLTLPLASAATPSSERVDLAVLLYERDVLTLGLAAKAAGMSYGRMIDELGRRGIPVVRYSVEDLDRELADDRTSAAGRR